MSEATCGKGVTFNDPRMSLRSSGLRLLPIVRKTVMDSSSDLGINLWRNLAQLLNSSEGNQEDDLFRDFARSTADEFSNVADYIWKTPNFIEQEITIEKEKLDAYFPLRGDDQKPVFVLGAI